MLNAQPYSSLRLPKDAHQLPTVYLTDKGYSIEDVLEEEIWQKEGRKQFPQDYNRRDTFWLRTKVIGQFGIETASLLVLPDWTHMDIFVTDRKGTVQQYQSGLLRSYRQKAYREPYNFLKLDVLPGDTMVVFARGSTRYPNFTSSMAEAPAVSQVAEASYLSAKFQDSWFLIFQVFWLLQFIVGLLAFLLLRQKIFLFFCLLNLGMLGYDMVLYPQPSLFYLVPQTILLDKTFRLLFTLISGLGILLFLQRFLQLKRTVPALSRFISMFLIVLVIVRLTTIAIPFFARYGTTLWTNPETPLSFRAIHLTGSILAAADS